MSKQNVKEEKRKGRGEKRGANGVILQLILSAVCIGIGALLIFVPSVQIKQLCYIFCGGLILGAVVEIAKFFITHAYDRLHDYSFSTGIMLLILGVCGVLRIGSLVDHFEVAIGFAALALGIVILQGMVQLNVVDNLLWVLLMIFTTLILVGSVLILLDIQAVTSLIPGFSYWLLFCSGIASIVSLLFVALGLYLYRRKRRKAAEAESVSEEEEGQNAAAAPLYSEEPEAAIPAPGAAADSVSASPYLSDTSAPTGETQVYPPISGGSSPAAPKAAAAAVKPAVAAPKPTVAEAPKPVAAAPKTAVAEAPKPVAAAPKPAATEAPKPVAAAPKPTVAEAPKPAAPSLKPAADLPVAEVPLYEEEKPVSSVSQDTEGLFPDDVRSEAEKSVKTVIELPEIIPPEDLL